MTTALPHPPRKFFIGNLHQIAGKDTMTKMIQLGYDYSEPLLEIKVLNFYPIFVFKASIAREILSKNQLFPKFIDIPLQHLRVITKDGLFTAHNDEPNWQKAHNILTPGFAQRSIRGYVPAMKKICDQLLETWEQVPEGKLISLSEDMTKLTFETIGVCGFDYSFGCFENQETHPFIPAMLFALDESIARTRLPPFLLPFRFKANALQKKHLAYTDQLIDEIINKKKADPIGNTSKFDLLSLMLNARDKDTNSKLSDENIRYQIYTFLVAGHETTSGLLSFTFYLLMKHPDWMAKVYEEIDSVWGAEENYDVSHRDIAQFPIIKQVLLETLRLYPSVPLITVAPTEDTTVGKENYPIAAEQPCLIWAYHLHRDPSIWGENAEQFNPDNFTPANIAQRDQHSFLAFGNGKRACIGRQFALTEATLAVATVLQRYQLELDPDYQFGFEETVTLRPKNIKVRLKKRTLDDRYHIKPLVKTTPEATVSVTSLHKTPFLVLYGSNMGNSEDLALQIWKDAQAHGFAAKMAPLDSYVDQLPKEGFVQIITSTYNGTPPDNAQKFYQWLNTTTSNLEGVQYSVFGCGNTQWETYQLFPNFVDRTLQRLGGQRVYKKGASDASIDFDGDFQQWYQDYWPTLLQTLGLKDNNESSSSNEPAPKARFQHPPALLLQVAEHFAVALDRLVQKDQKSPIALGDWLNQVELTKPASPTQLQALIEATDCPPDKMKLQAYLQQYETTIIASNKTVFELLQEFKACTLSIEQFVTLF